MHLSVQQIQLKGQPFKYANNWHHIEGYTHCIQEGLKAATLGSSMHKLIYILQPIKKNLKHWNKIRIESESVNQLEEEYNRAFIQLDADSEDTLKYNNILQIYLQLKEKQKIQHNFNRHQIKIAWL